MYQRLDQPITALNLFKQGLDHFPGEVTLLTGIARIHEARCFPHLCRTLAFSLLWVMSFLVLEIPVPRGKDKPTRGTVCPNGIPFPILPPVIWADCLCFSQEMNNIISATEYYKDVLKQDNTHVEAIACIGSNHFYTDQPEIALRFYRSDTT